MLFLFEMLIKDSPKETTVTSQLNRRSVLGLSTVAAAGTVLGLGAAVLASASKTPGTVLLAASTQTPLDEAKDTVAAIYRAESKRAGGTWHSFISVADPGGTPLPAVDAGSGTVVTANSVNKIAVATAVLDKIDRGLLSLSQTVDVTADIIIADGDGVFRLDGAYPSSITLGHAMAALLTVSDDTAVRLCGLVCPAAELNQILVSKGFPNTQVVPVANPNRFYLGSTTPMEMHNLLRALVNGTLLSASSTSYLLNVLRSPIAFTDGIRRVMSSGDRARVATKAGWFAAGREEAGIMFDTVGNPLLTYALFADNVPGASDFGATNPAVQARSVMGPVFLRAVDMIASGTAGGTRHAASGTRAFPALPYHPSNGG